MEFDVILEEKRDEILQLAAQYGAFNVRIFGSVARNEADQDSDIDFLVDMESGRSLLDLGGLLMELNDLSLLNELVQIWVIHHLQVIGEAVRALADEMRESHPDIPWTQIIGMRNILVHRYFGIDEDIVWTAINKDLPALKQKVKVLLDE
jgi:uncharacterized protein with HEPN domain